MPSDSFNLAEAMRNPATRRAAMDLEAGLAAHERGQMSRSALNRRIKRYRDATNQSTVTSWRNDPRNSAAKTDSNTKGLLSAAFGGAGKVKNVFKSLLGTKQSNISDSDIATTADLIRDYIENQSNARQMEDGAKRAWREKGYIVRPDEDDAAIDNDRKQRRRDFSSPYQESRRRALRRGYEDESGRLSQKFYTPESSNVYSFQYDYGISTLYVCYKAPAINPNAVSPYYSDGGIPTVAGTLGSTVMGKTNSAGSVYAYYDVPIGIFKRLKDASSAGTSVWDNLRVRGSVYGTQYRYSLVAGAVIDGPDGNPAVYVHRRATKQGYRSRNVVEPGTGKRRYVGSSLPQDLRGHGRSLRPNRGRPSPPNRGK